MRLNESKSARRYHTARMVLPIAVLICLLPWGCPPPPDDGEGPPPPPPEIVYPPPPFFPGLTIHPTPPLPDPLATPMDPPQHVRLIERAVIRNLQGGSEYFRAANDIALSQDGMFVYVANRVGNHDSTLEVFRRDTKGLGLTFVESFVAIYDDGTTVRRMTHATTVKLTADGNGLIITGESRLNSNGRAAFLASLRIDPSTGTLSQASMQPIPAEDHFYYFSKIRPRANYPFVISPDGTDIYTFGGRLGPAHHQLDPSTGALTEISATFPNPFGGDGTKIFTGDAAISPDGKHIYVNVGVGYSTMIEDLNVYLCNPNHLIFERNLADGTLTLVGDTYSGGNGHAWNFAVSADGQFVYANGPNSEPRIVIYERDSDSGGLTLLSGAISGQEFALTPDDSGLLVARRDTDLLDYYTRDTNTGLLTLASSAARVPSSPAGPVHHPIEFLAFSPDGQTIYAGGYDFVSIFSRNVSNNELAFVADEQYGQPSDFVGLEDIGAAALSRDGRRFYISSLSKYTGGNDEWWQISDGSLAVFERFDDGPALNLVDRILGSTFDPPFFRPNAIAVSDTNEAVFVSETDLGRRWPVDPFAVSPSGDLEYLGEVEPFGKILALVPDSNSFYQFGQHSDPPSSNQRDDDWVRFGRFNPATQMVELDEPFKFDDSADARDGECISLGTTAQVSRNGRDIYFGDYYQIGSMSGNEVAHRAIVHIRRDPDTDEIGTQRFHLFLEAIEDFSDVPEGPHLTLAPDGKNLYAFAQPNGETVILITDRNDVTGDLSNFRYWRTGIDSTGGPTDPKQLIVSPDGLHVLVLEQEFADPADEDGDWITRVLRFDRDPATGDLELDEVFESTQLRDAEYPTRTLFQVSDPSDANPILYIGAKDRILALDLN